MRLSRVLVSVDTHGAGEPTRIVLSGIPHFFGRTMQAKREHIQKHFDDLRLALLREPRGHNHLAAAIITEPVSEDAALGFLTMDAAGHWAEMSVSTSIAVVTVALQFGIIMMEEPVTHLLIDTPSGIIRGRAVITDGSVESVTIQNVPAFFVRTEIVDVPRIGKVSSDIAFGGNFFGFIKCKDLGIKITATNSTELGEIGIAIRDALNAQVAVQHPEREFINNIPSVILDDEPEHPDAQVKCVCIFGEGGAIAVDRSPCGTGLSARMAMRHTRGQLKLHEAYTQESPIGTIFTGKLIAARKVGAYDAFVPEISGAAYITGTNISMIEARDPLKTGFMIS